MPSLSSPRRAGPCIVSVKMMFWARSSSSILLQQAASTSTSETWSFSMGLARRFLFLSSVRIELRSGITHGCGVGEHPDGFLEVHRHADTLLVHQTEMVQCSGVEVIRSVAEHLHRTGYVGLGPLA